MEHHFFSPNSGEDQKKKVFTRNGTLFSPNSSTDLCSDAHSSQIIVGDADENHTLIVGGLQSNYLGDISPLLSAPLGRGYLVQSDKEHNDTAIAMNKERMHNFSICCIGSYLLISFIFFQNFILYCRVPSNVLAYWHVPKFF